MLIIHHQTRGDRNMVNDFLRYFNEPYETEFEAKTRDGKKVRFCKAYLDECIFIMYATILDEAIDEDGEPIICNVVGIGDKENNRSVFFLNDTSKKLFTPAELEKLQKISGSPLRDYDDIRKSIREAMDGTAPDKYIYEIPCSDSIACARHFVVEKDYEKFSFSSHPEEDIIQNVVDTIDDFSRAVEFDGNMTINKVAVRGDWANLIAAFFLTSVFYPEFPYYNLRDEKDSYVSQILNFIKRDSEDKTSLTFKYHTIPAAIQGQDTVTIDFLDAKKRPRTIEVKSVAFKSIKAIYDSGEKDIYMPITDEVSDTNSLLTLDMAFPDYTEDYYPRRWFPWGSILCIRSENQILWHFSEAMSEDPEDLEFHPIMRFDPVGEDYDF